MNEKIKKKRDPEKILEIIVAVFLGITALATAWASWIGSLHGGNQATNYTTIFMFTIPMPTDFNILSYVGLA